MFSDFPGNQQNRAVAYAGLGLNGFVMITLGTLVAPHPWPAVLAMFVIGVVVTFSGVLSETIAASFLGALSVLRSSALTTGTRVWRAVIGTGIGFLVGAALFRVPPECGACSRSRRCAPPPESSPR